MGSTILENDFEHFRSKLSLFWPRNGGFARSAAAALDHIILKNTRKYVYFLFTGPLDTIMKFAKKCFPPWRGAHFRFSSFFIKSHWKRKSNMPPSKKVLPAAVRSTFLIFTNFHFIAIMMHIDCAIFKNVLPAFGGEHNFAFYRLSQLRRRHANRDCLLFLLFWPLLGASWGQLCINLGQLCINLGQLRASLEPT